MKSRVLHVLPGFGIGGTELRVARLIRETADQFTHLVMSIDGGTEALAHAGSGVEMAPAPPKLGTLQFPRAMREAAQRIKPNLIVTYNWGATDMLLGARWGFPGRMIHNECGFNPEEAEGLIWRRTATRRIILNTIFKTVVVSERLYQLARNEFWIPEKRLQFIRTGVDVDRFRPGACPELRREWGVPDDALLVGYLGGFRGEKNVALLLTAFLDARLPNAWLVLVGDGPQREVLQHLIGERCRDPRVIFAGTRSDAVRCYQSLDVFTMSSLSEQTSNALLEAMACGLPCVVTDVGDNAVCLGSRDLVVPSRDVEGYTELLRRVATDPELRRSTGAANRARVEREYSFQRMVAEYRALWREGCRT